jgi:hypothetical protein
MRFADYMPPIVGIPGGLIILAFVMWTLWVTIIRDRMPDWRLSVAILQQRRRQRKHEAKGYAEMKAYAKYDAKLMRSTYMPRKPRHSSITR